MLIRQLVPKKIISYLDYSFMMKDTRDLVMLLNVYKGDNISHSDFDVSGLKTERLLFFGIWPGTGNGWGNSDLVESIRPLYQKYMPLFKAISEAGYEPVTEAYSNDEYCKIERFGNLDKENLYFTIRNYKPDRSNYEISIQISNSSNVLIYDLKTLKSIDFKIINENVIINMDLKGLETGVIKVIKKEALSKFKLEMALRQIDNLNKLIKKDNFWSNEEDNIKLRYIILENEAKCSDISSTVRYCESILDAIKDIEGRSKIEAEYLLKNALRYLSM